MWSMSLPAAAARVSNIRASLSPLRVVSTAAASVRGGARRMSAEKQKLVLWNCEVCPWAHRAWIAVTEKGVEHEMVMVDLRNKPQAFLDAYAPAHADTKARAKVPTLQHGDATLIESALVVEYLDEAFPNQGTQLYPSDPLLRYRVRHFVDLFMSVVFNPASGLSGATTDDDIMKHKADWIDGLGLLDKHLKKFGSEEGGDYLLGGTYSAAEVLTTPFVLRWILRLPLFRDIHLKDILAELGYERLSRWVKAVESRKSSLATWTEEVQQDNLAVARYNFSYVPPHLDEQLKAKGL